MGAEDDRRGNGSSTEHAGDSQWKHVQAPASPGGGWRKGLAVAKLVAQPDGGSGSRTVRDAGRAGDEPALADGFDLRRRCGAIHDHVVASRLIVPCQGSLRRYGHGLEGAPPALRREQLLGFGEA